ncbi:MAG: hypothetical protein H6R17_1068 [Proteobacteria bacterium]|nr:hypothetical protein [Pseudomonadota bacterium]
MKRKNLCCGLLASVLLGACGTTPPPVYYALDDQAMSVAKRATTPSVAIVQAKLPDSLDRPQLVIRSAANRVQLSEQRRWAEPLRYEIPRVLADDLGRLLDSSRVAALPVDVQRFSADFNVQLDIQRLEIVEGQGADLDLMWLIESRQGKVTVGRSTLREPLVGTGGAGGDTAALVAALRRALDRAAADIAAEIRRQSGSAPAK